MLNQAKMYFSIMFSIILLMLTLVQFSCNKESVESENVMTQEDFIRNFQGLWYITFYDKCLLPNCNKGCSYYLAKDSLRYFSDSSAEMWYTQNDSDVCKLTDIEYVQNWRIYEVGDSLILKTEDLCGVTISYIIKYENYHWNEAPTVWSQPGIIFANVKLVNPEKSVTLNNFEINNITNNLSFNWVDNINYKYSFVFFRQKQ
jgi:hypothetical protein